MSEIRIQKNETEELQKKDAGADFESFRQIIETLRSENGCPWDRAQTLESLKPCMVNEMTEAIAGIDLYRKSGNAENLCEELGDVLLQVVLLSQIAKEEGLFDIDDVIRKISKKMVHRHPHVFGTPEEREKMYKDLSEFLSIPEEYTHIGMFGEKTMGKVFQFCHANKERSGSKIEWHKPGDKCPNKNNQIVSGSSACRGCPEYLHDEKDGYVWCDPDMSYGRLK